MPREIAGFVMDVDAANRFLRVRSCRGRVIGLSIRGGFRVYRARRRAACAVLAPGDWVNVRRRD